MKDIPIIFSALMVRALLDGRKTMTRRLAWRTRINEGGVISDGGGGQMDYIEPHEERIGPSPWQRGQSGDRLWVREAVAHIDNEEFGKPSYWQYRADTDGKCFAGDWPEEERDNPQRPRWKPAIHMPRSASRITLIVAGTRVERLQEITEADAQAEGMAREFRQVIANPRGFKDYAIPVSYRGGFVNVWNRLHEVPHQWEDNPEVVALTGVVHKTNIDALPTNRPKNRTAVETMSIQRGGQSR